MRNHRRLMMVCGLLVWGVGLCWAAEGSHTAGSEEKPTLLTFDPGAAVWSIIVFLLLVLALRSAAWKPILRVLHEREQFIEKSIADAAEARHQAQKLLEQYQAQLERAGEEAAAIIAAGRREAEVVRRRLHEEARKEAQEIIARARREIQLAADAARKELHDEVSELAVEMAARILRRELSVSDHRVLVAQSLEAMREVGKARLN